MRNLLICIGGSDDKMQIRRIKIDGFKNIDNVQIELNKNILSLLSINSYGKSNFLNGLLFGFNFIHLSRESKDIMMSNLSNIPLNRKKLYSDFSFEIELIDKDYNNIIYGYSFSWKKNKSNNSKILEEYLKIKDNDSQKYSFYIKRNNDETFIKTSVTGGCSKKIKIENNELVINKLMAYDDLYYLELIKRINNINIYVDRHFNTNNLYDVETILRKNYTDCQLDDITNVPRILFKIKKDYPNKYEKIINTVKDIFPFINDIKVISYDINNEVMNKTIKEDDYFTIAKKIYFSVVIDKNIIEPIEISDMSDGVKRVLLIFTTLVLADINNYSLVAIEEPENSLNPKILQRYLIALNSFSRNTNVIITSHSPYLINYLNPSNIYLGLPNTEGVARFNRIKEKSSNKLLLDAKNMDMLAGDYLFDLMSGDGSDLEIINKYME